MKKRLFVVDDDSSVRESLKKVLEDADYEVVLAIDGRDAERKLDDPKIDLLILDLNMPGRDGWDVLEDVRSKHPLLPVIVVTGMADQLDTFAIPGIAALVKKPVAAPALLQKIESILAEAPEERLRRMGRSTEAGPGWQINGPTQSAAMSSLDFLNRVRSAGK